TFGGTADSTPLIAVKNHWTSLITLFLAICSLRAAESNSSQQHAAVVGESVLRLLEDRDVEPFADALALTNRFNRSRVSKSARLVLDQATRIGLEPSRVHFRIKEVLAKATGRSKNPQSEVKGDTLPNSFGIRIILQAEPVRDSQRDKPLRGEYELA